MHKVNWGILGTAKIGREKVIPAMQKSKYCNIVAIASRTKDKAELVSKEFNIPIAYNSYEELLEDSKIDAVYIPLPNHLHIPWAIKAIKANKHVLCEKPIGISAAETEELLKIAKRRPHLKIMEAFMYRFHPQRMHAKKMINDGMIGELKNIQSLFSYYNIDTNNIRNQIKKGGGAIMDIGCYCISLSRFIYGREPEKVLAIIERDPNLQIDRIGSCILDFTSGTSIFTCATQLAPYQRVNILGTEARIEIEAPFKAPPEKSALIWLHTKSGTKEVKFDLVDQYVIQIELFSLSIINDTVVPTPIDDAIKNMRVIDAVFQSAKDNLWETIL